VDVVRIFAALDRVSQFRFAEVTVFRGDREPALDFRQGFRRRQAFALEGLEGATLGGVAAHGYLGLADGHPRNGIATVWLNVRLLDGLIARLELDRAEHEWFIIVSDLPGHVPPPPAAHGGQRQEGHRYPGPVERAHRGGTQRTHRSLPPIPPLAPWTCLAPPRGEGRKRLSDRP